MQPTSHAFKDNAHQALGNATLQKAMGMMRSGFPEQAPVRQNVPDRVIRIPPQCCLRPGDYSGPFTISFPLVPHPAIPPVPLQIPSRSACYDRPEATLSHDQCPPLRGRIHGAPASLFADRSPQRLGFDPRRDAHCFAKRESGSSTGRQPGRIPCRDEEPGKKDRTTGSQDHPDEKRPKRDGRLRYGPEEGAVIQRPPAGGIAFQVTGRRLGSRMEECSASCSRELVQNCAGDGIKKSPPNCWAVSTKPRCASTYVEGFASGRNRRRDIDRVENGAKRLMRQEKHPLRLPRQFRGPVDRLDVRLVWRRIAAVAR